MQQIRENIYYVTYTELGKPVDKGPVKVSQLGILHLDIADLTYIHEYEALGIEPAFFIKPSAAFGGEYIVVSRQRASAVPPYIS